MSAPATGGGRQQRTWPVLRLICLSRAAWGRLGLAALAGFGAAAAGIGLMATSAWLISRAAERPPVLYLMVAIVAVRAFGLSRGLFRYAERLIGHDAALRVLGDLRARVYARLARVMPAGATELRDGDLVARFVADVDTALDVLVRVVLPYMVAALVAIGSVILLGTLLPIAGVVLAIGLAAVALGVPLLHSVVSRRAERATAPLRGQLTAETVALLHHLPDLVAYQGTDKRLAELAETGNRLRRATTRTGAAAGATGALATGLTGACAVLGLGLAAGAVHAHRLTTVLVAVIVLTPLAVFEALNGLSAAAADLRIGRAALARVFALLDRADPVPDPATADQLSDGPYELRLHGVHARWGATGPAVLFDVNLTLPAGSRTVIVGPSGSGKSTIAALLVRFLDPTHGRVTLNGTDLRRLTGDQVRRVVGLVDDRAHLFDSTIADNLRIGRPDATVGQLRAALRAAHLGAWVDALPDGLDTRVGEHGARVSGGQRRRIALARALLADVAILILDEPTEHLDDQTAAEITAELLGGAGDRTVVLITHRMGALDRADQVVHVAGGRVGWLVSTAGTVTPVGKVVA